MRLKAELNLEDIIELIEKYFAGPKGMTLDRNKVEVKARKGGDVSVFVELYSGDLSFPEEEDLPKGQLVIEEQDDDDEPAEVPDPPSTASEDDELVDGDMAKILAQSRQLEKSGEVGQRPGSDYLSELPKR